MLAGFGCEMLATFEVVLRWMVMASTANSSSWFLIETIYMFVME